MRRRRVLQVLSAGAAGGIAGCSSSAGTPTIEVPPEARRDEAVTITITGLDPGQRVTLTATVEGSGRGSGTWTAENTFEATEEGVVDLSAQSPVEGSYEGVDRMGWLWSMMSDDSRELFVGDRDGFTVRLDAATPGTDTTATESVRHERPNADPGVSIRRVPAADLVGVYAEPGGPGPHPPVLVLHGSGGQPLRRRAALLASHGYAVLALQYFGPPDPIPDTLRAVPLSYFQRAADWLRGRDAVAGGQVGVHGISRGGELALLLGARFDWVGAVVSYVGSGVVFGGGTGQNAAWSDGGEPVPYLPFSDDDYEVTDDGYYRVRLTYLAAYGDADEATLDAATIPVERIDGPVLLVSGRDDQLWPSTRLSEHAVDRLRNRGFDHPFDHLAYENAGHSILAPYHPTTHLRTGDLLLMGGTAAGYAHAAADAWPRVLEYLALGLR